MQYVDWASGLRRCCPSTLDGDYSEDQEKTPEYIPAAYIKNEPQIAQCIPKEWTKKRLIHLRNGHEKNPVTPTHLPSVARVHSGSVKR